MGCSFPKKKLQSNGFVDERQKIALLPSAFVVENKGRFQDVYTQGKILGSGTFGEVRTCFLKENGERRAVKIVKKTLFHSEKAKKRIQNEKDILKSLYHPTIVRLYEFFEDSKYMYIVMEYCSGSELLSQLLERSDYTEMQVAEIMVQIFSAMSFIHSKNIVHRDLKPESIYMDSKLMVKIIDFSEAIEIASPIQENIGALYYSAPEKISG